MATATKRATKQSATVRISAQSHLRLRELSAQEGVALCVVLDEALEQYQRKKFLEGCDAACAVLQQDPEAGRIIRKNLPQRLTLNAR